MRFCEKDERDNIK